MGLCLKQLCLEEFSRAEDMRDSVDELSDVIREENPDSSGLASDSAAVHVQSIAAHVTRLQLLDHLAHVQNPVPAAAPEAGRDEDGVASSARSSSSRRRGGSGCCFGYSYCEQSTLGGYCWY